MLDLHVWGPAFGLPSIDAECLATITYLHNALDSSSWRLIPSNDPSVSPSNQLPALSHDGIWMSGYAPIVSYLTSRSLCKDLNAGLQPAQLADSVAYEAYLTAHAGPLLDLSLYVSAANWSATTRPAFSALLPFPLTWTVPPLLRAEAVKRVEHLGLAELDSDFDPHSGFHLSTGRDALPETFRRHIPAISKKTVREEMTPEQATAIRLYSITGECLSCLDKFLGEEEAEKLSLRFFRGTSVSSLDCLAFGHLALMRDAPVPRAFIKDWLEQKTTRLSRFVDDMSSACLSGRGDLPWATPEPRGLLRGTARIFDSITRSVPSLGEHYATESRLRAERDTKGWDRRILMLTLGFIAVDLVSGMGVYWYRSLQPFGARYQVWRSVPKGLNQFGEVGSILSHALGPMPTGSGGPGNRSQTDARFVETDTEVD